MLQIIDTRQVQVGLDVDAALMTGGVSLYHHNKVITDIIANLCVCVYVCGESHDHGIHSVTIYTCS